MSLLKKRVFYSRKKNKTLIMAALSENLMEQSKKGEVPEVKILSSNNWDSNTT
jgi:hypothetical protein